MKSYEEKVKEIKEGKNLDKYLHDEDWLVRATVARRGYGLDILVNDENPYVRRVVAKTASKILKEKERNKNE